MNTREVLLALQAGEISIEDAKKKITKKKKIPVKQAAKVHSPGFHKQQSSRVQDIAIIGLSGRYPQARNIHEFWENIGNGKDCITEIPKDRWDHSLYFDEDKNKPGKTYCKWGGFLEGVAKFDPLFFNISPREAVIMDPKERLFLETVWNLLESAGYTRETLECQYQARVGVYVGAMYQQYHSFESDIINESAISVLSYSSIANRVSYFFNFQGPSIAVDTACSSSSLAIHMACESLKKEDCQLAIAGGVNLSIHPKKYLGLSLVQMLASHTNSRSFGKGDGFLPSEGVGAVLLKPLSKAIRDQDSILAIIKSTATNHKGHTIGYSVPNPDVQAQLMEENFIKSGIDPRSISYVESAANGSPLGDPIEIAALNKVFQKYSTDQQYCAIGSVKSNIGHAEAASGISQLTKVVLQLQHKQLVPSIKAEPLNPNISFTNTPFYLQQERQEWKRPVVRVNGKEQEFPRLAAVNSFGAGGSNVHMIVEEYIPSQEETIPIHITSAIQPQIVVFSAKNPDRLQAVIQQMLEFIEPQKELSLSDLAYTLQVGREVMEYRAAMMVSNQEELILEASIPIFTGNGEADHAEMSSLVPRKAGETMSLLSEENSLEKLALHWAQGGKISWESLHKGKRVRKLSLPTYPFKRLRCWVKSQPASKSIAGQVKSLASMTPFAGTTPLDHRVIEIISRILGMTPAEMDLNKPLDQYGFDSILLMQLLQQLQAQVDPLISLDSLKGCRTIQDIVKILLLQNGNKPIALEQQTRISIPTTWPQFPELIHLNQISQGRPVFWFHGALGGVEAFQGLAQKSARPFFGIQARGWMTDRSPLHGIQAMASYYIHIIQSVQPEGPYDLGGYSLGGMLAYEVTRQLQELGQIVDTIVMLDSLYGNELKKPNFSQKSAIFQGINFALLSTIQQEPKKITQTLIHRKEVNVNVTDEAFLKQLITLAKKRGLTKTKTQLHTIIQQSVKVQQTYGIGQFSVLPLPDPKSVTCYYFRNKGGLFFGKLDPYFAITPDEISLDHINYWEEWDKQLPNLHMMDVDSSNHIILLTEPKVYEKIFSFCERLYSKEGVSSDFLKSFKRKTKKKHISKRNLPLKKKTK